LLFGLGLFPLFLETVEVDCDRKPRIEETGPDNGAYVFADIFQNGVRVFTLVRLNFSSRVTDHALGKFIEDDGIASQIPAGRQSDLCMDIADAFNAVKIGLVEVTISHDHPVGFLRALGGGPAAIVREHSVEVRPCGKFLVELIQRGSQQIAKFAFHRPQAGRRILVQTCEFFLL
jgi:hypothetical protein